MMLNFNYNTFCTIIKLNFYPSCKKHSIDARFQRDSEQIDTRRICRCWRRSVRVIPDGNGSALQRLGTIDMIHSRHDPLFKKQPDSLDQKIHVGRQGRMLLSREP